MILYILDRSSFVLAIQRNQYFPRSDSRIHRGEHDSLDFQSIESRATGMRASGERWRIKCKPLTWKQER